MSYKNDSMVRFTAGKGVNIVYRVQRPILQFYRRDVVFRGPKFNRKYCNHDEFYGCSGAALTETGNVWTWGTHDSTNKGWDKPVRLRRVHPNRSILVVRPII